MIEGCCSAASQTHNFMYINTDCTNCTQQLCIPHHPLFIPLQFKMLAGTTHESVGSFEETKSALNNSGVSEESFCNVLAVLAVVLHLSNLSFESVTVAGGNEGSKIAKDGEDTTNTLDFIAGLLNIETSDLE